MKDTEFIDRRPEGQGVMPWLEKDPRYKKGMDKRVEKIRPPVDSDYMFKAAKGGVVKKKKKK